MTGQLVVRNGVLVIKDGEDNIPIHMNFNFSARIGKIYEFTYEIVGKTKYANLIKIIL